MQSMIHLLTVAAAGLLVVMMAGCASAPEPETQIGRESFGHTTDGTPVDIYTLRNGQGAEARIMTYGGIVVSLKVPDKSGALGDVVLGYETLAEYIKENPYFGCLVGRYGNRIANGRFTLLGEEYVLAQNNGPNHLHGGLKGFDKVVWKARAYNSKAGPALELRYLSPDGEEGYPGNLDVTAVYLLTEDNGLRLEYTATTDKPTVVNLTQHSYFNLAGEGDILGHEVMINADQFTPVDETLIPTGELRPVSGTPFDFRKATAIGARIGEDDQQLKFGGGYDHNWVIKKPDGKLGLQARVTEPKTGRVLEVYSTEPGLQFYSGNFLDGTLTGKGGQVYEFRHGFCMEPQHFPNSPNEAGFPSTVLRPGETYKNVILYRFTNR
jgi:aldose 1-epimerase